MKKIVVIALAFAGILGAQSQSPSRDYLGYIPYTADFGLSRMHELSSFSTNLSTARSAALGGAFTSLGADLSSMHINPAGLGMYRNSEFGITLGPSITETTTSMRGQSDRKGSRTSFGLNNFGAVFNVYEGAGATTSFSLGVGYSRLADYNYHSRMDVAGGPRSILDLYGSQVAAYAASEGEDMLNDSPFAPVSQGGAYMEEWGAMLAYHAWLLDSDGSIPTLMEGADIYKKFNVFSRGSAGEYALSGGWNFGNKLYAGFTIGFMDIYQDREVVYSETYSNNSMAEDPALGMRYGQYVTTMGEGVNAKLGLICRPLPELRIGVAFHTPTVISLRQTYNSSMRAEYDFQTDLHKYTENVFTPEVEFSEKYYTPSRLMAGVSYSFMDLGVLAIDYERAFYNGMGYSGSIYDESVKDDMRTMAKAYFTGSNTLRLGLEARATDILYARAGYVYSEEGVNEAARNGTLEPFDLPVRYESNVFSLGLGLRSGNVSFDATYSMLMAKYTDYDTFLYNTANTSTYPGLTLQDTSRMKQNRHNLLLSMSLRF